MNRPSRPRARLISSGDRSMHRQTQTATASTATAITLAIARSLQGAATAHHHGSARFGPVFELTPARAGQAKLLPGRSQWGGCPNIRLITSSAFASKHRPRLSKIRCGCQEWIFPSAAFAFRGLEEQRQPHGIAGPDHTPPRRHGVGANRLPFRGGAGTDRRAPPPHGVGAGLTLPAGVVSRAAVDNWGGSVENSRTATRPWG